MQPPRSLLLHPPPHSLDFKGLFCLVVAKAKTSSPYELREAGLQTLRCGQVMPFRKNKTRNAFFYSIRTKIGNIGEYIWQQPVRALRALRGCTTPARAPAGGQPIPSAIPCCSWPGSLQGPGCPAVPGAVPTTVPPGAGAVPCWRGHCLLGPHSSCSALSSPCSHTHAGLKCSTCLPDRPDRSPGAVRCPCNLQMFPFSAVA